MKLWIKAKKEAGCGIFAYWDQDFVFLMSGIWDSDGFLTGCGITFSLETLPVSDLKYSFFMFYERETLEKTKI